MNNKQVAELFVEQHVLQPSQVEDVLNEADLNGKTIAEAMVDSGFVDEHGFYQTIAEGLGTDFINLAEREIAPEILGLIPSGLARLHGALPIEMNGNTLDVALVDPLDLRAAEDLRFALGKEIHVVVSPTEQIEDQIKRYYGTDTASMEDIQKNIAGRSVDLRVSTLPTQFGESLVLRVLDRTTVNLDLEALGMPDYIHDFLLEVIHRPNGIFIATGPTGSGKTTTLYSCLRKINTIDSKLLTAEEPVEYDLEGIVQVPVNDAIGLTFARILRSFLRQDPDRIMVGETRDVETAQIAIQASLTGHLVFTTLHTNDAPGAITRLIDMGVEPFLISSTLEAVLGQRLLRSICRQCRTTYHPNDALLTELGISRGEIGDKQFFYGKGCDACNHTGYKGRKGIYELLRITDPLRELINERAPTVTIKQKAIELGMITLRQDGLRSIFAGDTTIEEVLRYT